MGANWRRLRQQRREHLRVVFAVPIGIAGFVGPVGQHDQRGITMLEVAGQSTFSSHLNITAASAPLIPSASYVTPRGPVRRPAEQAHRARRRVRARKNAFPAQGLIGEVARPSSPLVEISADVLAVVVKRQVAAAGLLQDRRSPVDRIPPRGRRLAGRGCGDTDAAEAVQAVAVGARQPFGVPSARSSARNVEAPVSAKRAAGEGKARAAVAEVGLEQLPQVAGPLVGRGMRIAELQDVDRDLAAARSWRDRAVRRTEPARRDSRRCCRVPVPWRPFARPSRAPAD